jgi:hypothetical protein
MLLGSDGARRRPTGSGTTVGGQSRHDDLSNWVGSEHPRTYSAFVESKQVVLAYCSSGPYRHLAQLLAADSRAWFPWGYRSRQVSTDASSRLVPGAEVEIWEVDDTRQPISARPMIVAHLDLVLTTSDYVAMTLRCCQGEPLANEADVLREVQEGRLAFEVHASRETTPERVGAG